MFCTNCGKEVQEGLKFCTYCGNKMFSQNSCYVPKPGEVDVPPVVPDRKSEIYGGVSDKDYDKEESGVTYASVLVGIVVVAVILVAGFFLFIWEKPEQKNEDVITANGQTEENAYYNYITGNGSNSSQTQTQARTEPITQATEAQVTMSTEERELTEKMYALMNDNLYCVLEMFYFKNHLPTTGRMIDVNLEQVDPTIFSNFNEYTSFLYSVYNEGYAFTKFIEPAKYFGDQTGLALNKKFDDAKYYDVSEYYVDWSNYELEIIDYENYDFCRFKVTATKNSPTNGKGDYEREGRAVWQNGRWLLESVVY